MNPTSSDITSLLTQKLSDGQTFSTLYVTAFTVYLMIIGALLKFTIDAITEGNSTIKQLLTQVGIGTSLIYLLACVFQWIVGQQLSADIEHLNAQLGRPLESPQMLVLRFESIVSGSFTLFALFGWVCVLRRVKVKTKNAT